MNNFLLSKYIPGSTFIHNLDPRTKIFFTILYLINVFIASKIIEFTILVILLILIGKIAKINFIYLLKSIKAVFFVIIFTSLVHLVFNKSGERIIDFGFIVVYSGALRGILIIIIRFCLVVMIMLIFMMTTSPTEITRATEKSLSFLNKFKIPIDTLALMLSITLRFIPTIGEETSRIVNAQISRGSNYKKGNFLEKIKKFIPILIPLFIATLKRADELATAMEVRGYIPNAKRTNYKKLQYKKSDYFSYILIIIVTILVIVI